MPRFRTGTKVAQNVYDGDRPAFQAHSDADAERYVALLNIGERIETTGTKEIAKAIWDPGAILPRGDNFEEPVAAWQTRAVMHVLLAHETPLEAPQSASEPTGAQEEPSGPWTAQNLPEPLVEILDRAAGKVHSEEGSVRSALAEILNAYDHAYNRTLHPRGMPMQPWPVGPHPGPNAHDPTPEARAQAAELQEEPESREGHTGLVIQERASFRASETSARLLRHSDGAVYERVGGRCGFDYRHPPCESCYRVFSS